jgi:hypothetical protein
MMKTAAALILLAALVNAANAHGDPTASIPRFEIRGPRVHSKDVLGSTTDVDLGATPPIGASRVIERSEIERAYASASATPPKKIPAAVRVTRKARRLTAPEVGSAIRSALAETKLPRGATLSGVRASAAEVPDDFQRVTVDLPTLPRRAGQTTVAATVTFLGDGDAPLMKALVPIELSLPPGAAFAEITRGAPITLVVRRGLVEVSVSAVAAVDSDVGAVLPVTLRPSGRVLRARAIDKDHAVALEDS